MMLSGLFPWTQPELPVPPPLPDDAYSDDEQAERLLTTFPPYGSQSVSPTQDWFFTTKKENTVAFEPEQDDDEEIRAAENKPSVLEQLPAVDDWDADEQALWKASQRIASSEEDKNSQEPPVELITVVTDKKQQLYWMPDQLCKTCYGCEAPFTVFRRRHHCRLCGQVFCNTCSSFVSDDSTRICRLCHQQKQGETSEKPERDNTASTPRWLLPSSSNPTSTTPGIDDAVNDRNIRIIATDSALTPSAASLPPAASTLKAATASVPNHADMAELIKQGQSHLGLAAANHLENLATHLLRQLAPLLWNSLAEAAQEAWTQKLLALATRCCATVEPNVKKGDLLDIRPYVKIKCIPGGSFVDCSYLSGVVFRKHVSHKQMAKEVLNPKILLLSGGIEFTRNEHRIASLETLFEQEEKYLEILISKLLKHSPDLVLTGRNVSRRGQELLLQHNVVLIQHVKIPLLRRIARQTNATLISSTDHVMNQFGPEVLGSCRRFRLATFRNNELWVDTSNENNAGQHSIPAFLSDSSLSIPERQAALAAQQLGQGVIDGVQAVKSGLTKRGVSQTYILLEGCPKHLGCTVVLRGAERAALKEVKTVFRFLVNIAYNLRLETSFLRERGARIRPDFVERETHAFSSSLCVDFGPQPPTGSKKIRPWNGGNPENVPRPTNGEITAFDHQSILVTSIWMTEKTQCCPSEVKGICYYSMQDVALGQFLRDSCFNLNLKCQNASCKKTVLDHSLSFVHNDGLMSITVEELEEDLPPSPYEKQKKADSEHKTGEDGEDMEGDRPIATWTYCKNCRKVVSPLVYVSESTWKLSFGKFLEVFFYNRDAALNAPEYQCSCQLQQAARLYFGCGRLAARFNYEPLRPFGVFARKHLPMESIYLKEETIRRLEMVSSASSQLFVKFDKHIERVSREARSLFNSPVNRPEHLQTVLSELNQIGSDVDHVARTLQEKVAAASDGCRHQLGDEVLNQAIVRFPWFARRYLFLIASAWNDKLGAIGQAISTMKKIAGSSSSRHDGVANVTIAPGDPLNEALVDSMKRIRKLNEQYARLSVTDITQVLPALPGGSVEQQDDDDEFDDPDTSIDFADGVDADVIASRRRLRTTSASSSQTSSVTSARPRPTKSLGTRRPDIISDSVAAPPKATAGGAVKSAITRFFNRGGRDSDMYTVDLGIFAEGRPRLAPGMNGIILPVYDEQLSTTIAYSLASLEYAKQFKHYSRNDSAAASEGGDNGQVDRTVGEPQTGFRPNDNANGAEAAMQIAANLPPAAGTPARTAELDELKDIERRMLTRSKSHIKHTFREFDDKGQVTCKLVCTTYWATQFHAVRQVFLSRPFGKFDQTDADNDDVEQSYLESLSSAALWDASGGKSGASFARTSDDRFVIKCISRTELQMFLDCAPAYFEYLSKAFFHGLPTVLCKIVGVYQIGIHNRVTGKRSMEQVAVMQNIFYNKKINRVFDLKGSLRGRFAAHKDEVPETPSQQSQLPSGRSKKRPSVLSEDGVMRDFSDADISKELESEDDRTEINPGTRTLLDGDFLEFTLGRPMPLTDRAKAVFQMSILNDTLFLSIINVLDYSILVGVDEENRELVVGIIDFMRQYDILKQMERVGKSLPMVVGSEAPTIIQPPLYKARFTNAMERYFMTVPSKWTSI